MIGVVVFNGLLEVLDQLRGHFTRCTHPRELLRGSLHFLFAVDTDIIIVECEAAGGALGKQLEHFSNIICLFAAISPITVIVILSWGLALADTLVLQDRGAAARGNDLA